MPRLNAMDKSAHEFLSAVHKLDKYVLGPTSLVIFDEHAKGTTGIFANTMNELYKKMELREIERLYDILDGSELCRYVSCHKRIFQGSAGERSGTY